MKNYFVHSCQNQTNCSQSVLLSRATCLHIKLIILGFIYSWKTFPFITANVENSFNNPF